MQQDAAKLLLERILLQLQKGNISVFRKMLLIMDHYGVNTAKTMSVEIRSKLRTVKCGKGMQSYACTIIINNKNLKFKKEVGIDCIYDTKPNYISS